MRWKQALLSLAATCFGVASAWAQESPAVPQAGARPWARDLHAGIDARTDFGTHPLRLDFGARWKSWDLVAVVDPMFFLDNQHDTDLVGYWEFTPGWSTFLGWRGTAIGILDGYQWQQKSLHGVAARLPELASGHLRGRFGIEAAVLWAKHGGGVDTEPISFRSSRDWLDHVNLGMFLSFDVAYPF